VNTKNRMERIDSMSLRAGTLLAALILLGVAVTRSEAADSYSAAGDSHPAYIPLQGANAVGVRDSRTLRLIATVPTGLQSIDSRLTPDGTKLYVINTNSSIVTVIRAQCPRRRSDWHETERQAGKCTENTKLGTITLADNNVINFSISKDGRTLYLLGSTGGFDSPPNINVVDIRTDTITRIFSAALGTVASVISPDGRLLWTSVIDGTLQALDANTGAVVGAPVQVEPGYGTNKLSNDGRYLYTATIPLTLDPVARLNITDTRTRTLLTEIDVGPGTTILSLEVSPDSCQVWTANGNNTVSVFNAKSRTLRQTIKVPFAHTMGVDVTADNKRVLVVGFDGELDLSFPGNQPAYAQLYSTITLRPLGPPVSLGNTSGGIPAITAD
jgi:DNA-binding beta-propeller fold protein YncE